MSTSNTDPSSSATDDSDDNAQTPQPTNEMAAMKKLLMESKVDDGKSVWTMTLETFGMADGKTKRGDIVVDTPEQGLELLTEYVTQLERKDATKVCWDLVPLEQLQATREMFLMAFVKWAEKEQKNDGKLQVNVSKAIRRLDAYFQWMHENQDDLKEPLTVASIAKAAKVWDIQITYDNNQQFVWWIDLGSLDKAKLKELDNKDHLRYIVWFAHVVLLDKNAQQNGALIVEDMGHMGFWKMATLVPNDLGAKMDRLTIGILPVRVKAIYVFGAATWMSLLMALLKPFMGKKMRERMKLMPHKTDMQAFCDDLVGTRQNIPVGFCELEGEAPRDTFLEKFAK